MSRIELIVMTLIAAFKARGVPVLVGDFVLSALGTRIGKRKKVCRLGTNCVLAWTGRLSTAEQVFRILQKAFSKTEFVSKEALKESLTKIDEPDYLDKYIVIIGWLVEGGKPLCFRWRSDWPHEVVYDRSAFEGSGKSIVERWCGGPKGIHDAADPSTVDLDQAVNHALAITTNLMSEEILANDFGDDISKLTFGHAYEIAYLTGEEFRYVTNVLYLAVSLTIDESMQVKSKRILGTIYKYRSFGDYSVTEQITPDRGIEVNAITSVAMDDEEEGVGLLRSVISTYRKVDGKFMFPVESDYYCIFLHFIDSRFKKCPLFSIVQPPYAPEETRFVRVADDGNLVFQSNNSLFEDWYKKIRQSQDSPENNP